MNRPPIFHVTHWKAGSQWVRAVLAGAAGGGVESPDHNPNWFSETPIVVGRVYTPVYARYEQFRAVVPKEAPQRTFVVIRDLRDTAVSWYFSLLHSHTLDDQSVLASRTILGRLSKTDGMALVISNHLRDAAEIQKSWMEREARIFKYEELRCDQEGEFAKMLEFCGIELPAGRQARIVARNTFERKTWWRFGRENAKSHLRKGVAGDWRNHFCPRLQKLFKLHYGQILIRAGYERDDNW